ncbi:MAG: hypothetical protein HXX16_04140 [Bacteroidales bacterium]|nr:hypothetical protein [Bacteroidales bacterium]
MELGVLMKGNNPTQNGLNVDIRLNIQPILGWLPTDLLPPVLPEAIRIQALRALLIDIGLYLAISVPNL